MQKTHARGVGGGGGKLMLNKERLRFSPYPPRIIHPSRYTDDVRRACRDNGPPQLQYRSIISHVAQRDDAETSTLNGRGRK